MDTLCKAMAEDLDTHFPTVVKTLQGDVHAGLRRLHGADAEDLTQETFVRAYRALRTYPPARIEALQLRGWIWTIALNLGRNRVRDQSRRPIPVELHDHHGVEDPEPPDTRAWDKRLQSLSLTQRRAVVLRHVVGLSNEDVATAMGRPIGTVKADVHRGLAKLRTIIEEEA